jgi:hypothetical protein
MTRWRPLLRVYGLQKLLHAVPQWRSVAAREIMEHKIGHNGCSCRRGTQDWTQRRLVYTWNPSLGTVVARADIGYLTELIRGSERIF